MVSQGYLIPKAYTVKHEWWLHLYCKSEPASLGGVFSLLALLV